MRLYLIAALVFFIGCRKPMTELRSQPSRVQAVEVIWEDPAESRAASERLAQRLGVPVYDEASGSKQVLRVTLAGSDISPWAGSLTRTCLGTSGAGLLTGLVVALPATASSLTAVGVVGGVGFLCGLAYGPFEFHANQDQLQKLGYYPWTIRPTAVDLVDRYPAGGSVIRVSYRVPNLNERPFLKPLSREEGTKAGIRRQSLVAFMDALVDYLDRKKIPAA